MTSHRDTIASAAAEAAEARRKLDEAMAAAVKDSVPITVVAAAAGISRSTVYERLTAVRAS